MGAYIQEDYIQNVNWVTYLGCAYSGGAYMRGDGILWYIDIYYIHITNIYISYKFILISACLNITTFV